MPVSYTAAPQTTAAFQGLFTSYGAMDAFGIPMEIVDSLVKCYDLVDFFDWEFNNEQVLPADIMTSLQGTTGDGSFVEGGCPEEMIDTICRITYNARSLGRCSPKLTLPAWVNKQHQAPASRRIRNRDGATVLVTEFEYQLYKVLQGVRKALGYLIIRGDPTVNANNFDGLLRIIRTGRLDINGVWQPETDSIVHDEHCTAVTILKIEEVIGQLEDRWVDASDITMIMRPGMFRHLSYQISLGYADIEAKHQELLAGKTLPLGGVDIPVITTQCLPTTGAGQDWCSDILFITTEYLGLPSLFLQFFDFSEIVANAPDVYAPPAGAGGLTPSPFIMLVIGQDGHCMSHQFCLAAHGRLVSLAPQSLAKIQNVAYSALLERQVVIP